MNEDELNPDLLDLMDSMGQRQGQGPPPSYNAAVAHKEAAAAAVVPKARPPAPARPASAGSSSSEGRSEAIQAQIVAEKKKALQFKNAGKMEEAKAAMRNAKALEASLLPPSPSPPPPSSSVQAMATKVAAPSAVTKPKVESVTPPSSQSGKGDIQAQIIEERQRALQLSKAGKKEEAMAALRNAKALEASLSAKTPSQTPAKATPTPVMAKVESVSPVQVKPTPAPVVPQNLTPAQKIQAQILAEKKKAMQFKNAGKKDEAIATMKNVKVLEASLLTLSQDATASTVKTTLKDSGPVAGDDETKPKLPPKSPISQPKPAMSEASKPAVSSAQPVTQVPVDKEGSKIVAKAPEAGQSSSIQNAQKPVVNTPAPASPPRRSSLTKEVASRVLLPGETGDTKVELTDKDMMDPELLGELDGLGGEEKIKPPRKGSNSLIGSIKAAIPRKLSITKGTDKKSGASAEENNKTADSEPGDKGAKTKPAQKPAQTEHDIPDDAEIELTEEDMMDPELLGELDNIDGDENVAKPSPKPAKGPKKSKGAESEDEMNVELTEEDMNDPELLGELDMLDGKAPASKPKPSASVGKVDIPAKIAAEKKKATQLYRAGKKEEATAIMNNVKVLEASLATAAPQKSAKGHGSEFEDEANVELTEEDMNDPELLGELGMLDGKAPASKPKPSASVGKVDIPAKIVAEKQKAAQLHKAGKKDEAMAIMKNVKVLEASLATAAPQKRAKAHGSESEDEMNVELTEEDMNDPELLGELDMLDGKAPASKPKPSASVGKVDIPAKIVADKQRAAQLYRAGKKDEAMAIMNNVKILEANLATAAPQKSAKGHGSESEDELNVELTEEDMNDPELLGELGMLDGKAPSKPKTAVAQPKSPATAPKSAPTKKKDIEDEDEMNVELTEDDMNDPELLSALEEVDDADASPAASRASKNIKPGSVKQTEAEERVIEDQIKNLKKRALQLKSEGKIEEAKAEYSKAKALESANGLSKDSRPSSSSAARSVSTSISSAVGSNAKRAPAARQRLPGEIALPCDQFQETLTQEINLAKERAKKILLWSKDIEKDGAERITNSAIFGGGKKKRAPTTAEAALIEEAIAQYESLGEVLKKEATAWFSYAKTCEEWKKSSEGKATAIVRWENNSLTEYAQAEFDDLMLDDVEVTISLLDISTVRSLEAGCGLFVSYSIGMGESSHAGLTDVHEFKSPTLEIGFVQKIKIARGGTLLRKVHKKKATFDVYARSNAFSSASASSTGKGWGFFGGGSSTSTTKKAAESVNTEDRCLGRASIDLSELLVSNLAGGNIGFDRGKHGSLTVNLRLRAPLIEECKGCKKQSIPRISLVTHE